MCMDRAEMHGNKRRQKRVHLIHYLRILDTDSDAKIGHLVDITPQGIMIISEAPIPVGKDFSFQMQLPEMVNGFEEVYFSAHSLWCKQDFMPEFYVSGYAIKDISSPETKTITALMKCYGFKSM